jgi:hypothetical protein
MMSDTNTPAVLARSCEFSEWLTCSTNEHAHEGRQKYAGPRYVRGFAVTRILFGL